MIADLAAATSHPQHEVGPGVHRGELGHPDMLEESQDGELPLLVDQGVIGEDREVEEQINPPGWK